MEETMKAPHLMTRFELQAELLQLDRWDSLPLAQWSRAELENEVRLVRQEVAESEPSVAARIAAIVRAEQKVADAWRTYVAAEDALADAVLAGAAGARR
jgi:hypothetical protein